MPILLHFLFNSGNFHGHRALAPLGHAIPIEHLLSNYSFFLISRIKLHFTVLIILRQVLFARSLLLQRARCFTNY